MIGPALRSIVLLPSVSFPARVRWQKLRGPSGWAPELRGFENFATCAR